MTCFPQTHHAWCRFKLLWAEMLVSGFAKGNHSHVYLDLVSHAREAIADFREIHYSAFPSQPRGGIE
jgi:hypothetical protein